MIFDSSVIWRIDNKPNLEGPGITAHISPSPRGIEIAFEGFGASGIENSPIIYIEQWEGKLRLHIWADINSEDPTHSICLDGARDEDIKSEANHQQLL
jgi:hypothetical protein